MRHENDRYRGEIEKEPSVSSKLGYLLVGGSIGAILALLFAPKSGEELRGDIADVTRKGLDKTRETAALVGEKAGEYYEVSREKAGELYSTAQDKASEFYSTAQQKAGELTGKAKDAVAQKGNPISAAIEAGKQAYSDEKRRTENMTIGEAPKKSPVEDRVLELPKETENKKS